MTKYTALFIVPVILLYFLLKDRSWWRRKELYQAFLLGLVVVSPVIVYNVFMYKETGHFDLQWAGLFHQQSPWNLNRDLVHGYGKSFQDLWNNLAQSVGFLYLGLALGVFVYLAFRAVFQWRQKKQEISFLLFISFWSIVALIVFMGAVIGPEVRFLVLFTPFWAVFLGIAAAKIVRRKLGLALGVILGLYLVFFAGNALLLSRPWGKKNISYPALYPQDYGVYALDKYLDNLLAGKRVVYLHDFYQKLKRKKPSLAKYKLENNFHYKSGQDFYSIFVWDPNINWFSSVWLFERRRFYDNLPFLSAWELKDLLEKQGGVRDFYFIQVADNGPLTPSRYRQEFGAKLAQDLKDKGAEVETIYRADGQAAFFVYHYAK